MEDTTVTTGYGSKERDRETKRRACASQHHRSRAARTHSMDRRSSNPRSSFRRRNAEANPFTISLNERRLKTVGLGWSRSSYRTLTRFGMFPKQRNPDKMSKAGPGVALGVSYARTAAYDRLAGPPNAHPLTPELPRAVQRVRRSNTGKRNAFLMKTQSSLGLSAGASGSNMGRYGPFCARPQEFRGHARPSSYPYRRLGLPIRAPGLWSGR